MVHKSSPLILITDTFTAFRTRWKTACSVFCLVGGAVVAYLLTAPLEFASEGKLNVQVGRGIVSDDRIGSDQGDVSFVETRESEINTVLDILGSRGLLENVVDEIGVERITESECLANEFMPGLSLDGGKDVLTDRELRLERDAAIRHLSSQLSVHNPRKSSIITLRASLGSPELAQEVVQLLMEKYLESHISAHETEGSREFFEASLPEKEQAVADCQNRIRDFKNDVGVMNVALAQQAARDQISQIEKDSVAAISDLASGKARIEELEVLVKQTPIEIDAERTDGFSNEAADRIRDQLFAVERDYQALLSSFDESHPKAARKKEELDKLREIHKSQSTARTQTKKIKNPMRSALELDLLRAEAEAVALQARVDTLARKHKEAMVKLNGLNRYEVELADMQRELDVAEANLKTISDKLEKAKINLAMDSEQISNVKIRQPATYEIKSQNPKKGLTLAAGGMLAIFAAIGAALVHHHLVIDRVSESETAPVTNGQSGLGTQATLSETQSYGTDDDIETESETDDAESDAVAMISTGSNPHSVTSEERLARPTSTLPR